jgi:anti-sigma regulatory factor (Ser/Thr protein kinase)
MVSEAVSNAILHGQPEADGRIGLRLEPENGVIRVAVTDGAPMFHLRDVAFDGAERSHHGLFMLDALADRWGLSLDGKKAIWFEVESRALR